MAIDFYVIHNRDRTRLDALLPAITQLAREVPALNPDVRQVWFQPELREAAPFGHRVAQSWAENVWQHLAFSKYFERPLSLRRRLGYFLRFVADAARQPSRDQLRLAHIRRVLTDKHLRALGLFLDSEASYAIIAEDDLIVEAESAENLKIVLAPVFSVQPERLVYVDLAGGFRREVLSVDSFALGREYGDPEFLHRYAKVATNTLCCYLVNRACAGAIYSAFSRYPELRRLPADWAINTASSLIPNIEAKAGLFALTEPPIFTHGSLMKHYPSSILP